METVAEYGCAHCGGKIINPALIPLDYNKPVSKPATECNECGYETAIPDLRGFQCPPETHAVLHRFCTPDELKQLRLDPYKSIVTLNRKLVASVNQELEVDITTKPPTIRKKL